MAVSLLKHNNLKKVKIIIWQKEIVHEATMFHIVTGLLF